jgi:hypothetical protein
VTTYTGPMTVDTAGPTRAVVRQELPSGSVRAARGWVLHGTTLIQVDASAGDPNDPHGVEGLPGGAGWFRAVLDRAESRMDG